MCKHSESVCYYNNNYPSSEKDILPQDSVIFEGQYDCESTATHLHKEGRKIF